MRKKIFTLVLTVALLAATVLSAGSVFASSHLLAPFTQTELDTNWEADRQFPSGGVTSVSAFGRDYVAQIGIDSDKTDPVSLFRRTEGIKTTAGDFGTVVQVDLYVDPNWATKAVRAGFWVVGDNGAGARDNKFGIVEFVNNEPCDAVNCSNPTNITDHEGWRVWDSTNGWTNSSIPFTYGEWATLAIELDTTANLYHFSVNGEHIGSGPGGAHFIRELFLNSYNYGLDTFPNLSSDSYAAHWHVGLLTKDDCKDGGWETFTEPTFKNQGQCVSYMQADARAGK